MKLLAPLLLMSVFCTAVHAQDLTNKGKDFWLGYGYHVSYTTGNSQEMVLYFATDAITTITVEIPGNGYSKTYANIPANTIFETDPLPKSGTQDARLATEQIYNSGIHVTSDKPVVAYEHIYNSSISGATLLFPTSTLGKDYYSINYTQKSNAAASNGFFFVVAADTGTTTVEITPSATTLLHAAGVPFQVNLTQGQIYNVMGTINGLTGVDLTGSHIRSISTGTNSCKRIAVFSGSGKIFINCGSGQANSADNLIAQAFPKSAWGLKFLTAPTKNMEYNYFRVGVSDPTAVVKVNGNVIGGLINNFYYDLPLTNQPILIESSLPATVAQYITTAGSGNQPTCGNRVPGNPADGDPEMIYLSPVEQTTDKVILNSTSHYLINQHFVNLIIKSNAVNSVLFDGSPIPGLFSPHPGDPNYSYAQVPVISGQHSVQADSGFNVIAYGYGGAESYGYNGGTNIKDLYQFISIINPYSIVNTPTACSQSPFYFSITLPYKPLSLLWNLHDPNRPNTTDNSPTPTSTTVVNGRTLYQYKLPIQYTYAKGTYPITVIANNPTVDGCSGEQQIDFDLNVYDPPVSDFYTISTGCVNTSIQFKDTSNTNGRAAYKWFWDFGDGSPFEFTKNPTHTYKTADTFKVRYAVVTDIGCLSDTITKNVYVTNVPVASYSISQPTCVNSPLTFTDNSKLVGPGVLSKWVWDYNDGPIDSVSTNASKTHSYPSVKTYFSNLNVYTSSGCKSLPDTMPVVIHPFPVADFSLPEVCLPGGVGQFFDSSKIADPNGTPFKYLWNFGDAPSGNKNIDSIKNPSHYFNTTGPYTISLQVTSKNGCASSVNKSLVDIYPATKSAFAVNNENCLNDSTRFTDQTDAPAFPLVKWHWDFGDGKSDTVQNPVHVYTNAATYTIKYYGITNKGCNTDTSTKQVIINPLPTANFINSVPDCVSKSVLFTDKSVANAGNLNSWSWSFGDGNSSSQQNPLNAYAASGKYNAILNVATDKGCKSKPDTMVVTINPTPVAGFISPEVCLSDAFAQFLDSSKVAGGTITNWSWNFADPTSGALNTSNLQNPQHQYHAVGNYPVQLTVTTNSSCVATITQTITVNGDKPKSNFTVVNPTGLCANDSVGIQDGSSVNFGTITKLIIYWDDVNNTTVGETDDNPFPGKVYHHIYPNFQQPLTKSFTIRYKVYSGSTCVNEISKTILLHAAPKVVFTAMPDVCLEAPAFQITQAKETGGVPGTPSFTGAGVSSTGIFSPSVAGVGLHTIHYTFTSSAGCIDTASTVIKVLQAPVANFSYSSLDCEKTDITFSDSSSATDGTIVKWVWNFNDGSAIVTRNSNAPFTHNFNTANTYNVTLTVTTDNNCNSSTFSKQIVVHPYPVPDFTVSKTCLPNANAGFTNATKIGDGTLSQVTYLWDFGDPNSGPSNNASTQMNPSHTYSAVGPYQVHLTTTSSNGCIHDTVKVYNDIHPQPVAKFIPSIIEICVGATVTFNDQSTSSDGAINAWNWSFGDGGSSSLQSPSRTFPTSGTFSVKETVTNSNACVSDVYALPITVDAYPTVNAKPDRFVLEGDTIHLSPVYNGVSLTYLWTPPDYLNSDKVPSPVLTGVNDRVYTITVTGKGDCSASDMVAVKVLRTPKVPNTFSPNQDGINDFWVIENLQYYKNARVQIFDRYGQTVFESVGYATPWDGNYKQKPVPFGTYYYIIDPGNGRKPITGYVTVLK